VVFAGFLINDAIDLIVRIQNQNTDSRSRIAVAVNKGFEAKLNADKDKQDDNAESEPSADPVKETEAEKDKSEGKKGDKKGPSKLSEQKKVRTLEDTKDQLDSISFAKKFADKNAREAKRAFKRGEDGRPGKLIDNIDKSKQNFNEQKRKVKSFKDIKKRE
ncbi:MAG: hypothetical protein AB1489_35165, partial [Acidobacteriota bacterium]